MIRQSIYLMALLPLRLLIKVIERVGDAHAHEAGLVVLQHDALLAVLVADGQPDHDVHVELVQLRHLDAVVYAASVQDLNVINRTSRFRIAC